MARAPATLRHNDHLLIRRELVDYGRNIILEAGGSYTLQRRLFVNDPWELIAEAIARAVSNKKHRDLAQSFRRQAEDYFNVATTARELATRPVLFYYAFLNLSKAFGLAKGNTKFASRIMHGLTCTATRGTTVSTPIRFVLSGSQVGAFQELFSTLSNPGAALGSQITLGQLMPQILPGHRLWCYAANKPERFISPRGIYLFHDSTAKTFSIRFDFIDSDLDRPNLLPASKTLSYADLADFEIVSDGMTPEFLHFQQKSPTLYTSDPEEALKTVVDSVKNRLWETVRVGSPYRKAYFYFCPANEKAARLPQLLSIYLLMFFLGYVTRYSPGYFDDLIDAKYGPFFSTFISESPMQFLYLMASEILGREVSKPAII